MATKRIKCKAKFPTTETLRLGPWKRKRGCGCLLYHASRIDGATGCAVESVVEKSVWRRENMRVVEKFGLVPISATCADDTMPNRKLALSLLRQGIKQCGGKIHRDRTITFPKAEVPS